VMIDRAGRRDPSYRISEATDWRDLINCDCSWHFLAPNSVAERRGAGRDLANVSDRPAARADRLENVGAAIPEPMLRTDV
jgi:hypothetical protein